MTFGYWLLLETIEAAPAPNIEYLGMASGGEEPAAEVSFLSPPLPSVLGEQQKRERGERKPTDIVVAVQCSAVLSAVQYSAVLAAVQCSAGRSEVKCSVGSRCARCWRCRGWTTAASRSTRARPGQP